MDKYLNFYILKLTCKLRDKHIVLFERYFVLAPNNVSPYNGFESDQVKTEKTKFTLVQAFITGNLNTSLPNTAEIE